jgi:hypothetical protein
MKETQRDRLKDLRKEEVKREIHKSLTLATSILGCT